MTLSKTAEWVVRCRCMDTSPLYQIRGQVGTTGLAAGTVSDSRGRDRVLCCERRKRLELCSQHLLYEGHITRASLLANSSWHDPTIERARSRHSGRMPVINACPKTVPRCLFLGGLNGAAWMHSPSFPKRCSANLIQKDRPGKTQVWGWRAPRR